MNIIAARTVLSMTWQWSRPVAMGLFKPYKSGVLLSGNIEMKCVNINLSWGAGIQSLEHRTYNQDLMSVVWLIFTCVCSYEFDKSQVHRVLGTTTWLYRGKLRKWLIVVLVRKTFGIVLSSDSPGKIIKLNLA